MGDCIGDLGVKQDPDHQGNRILSALPAGEREFLLPRLFNIAFQKGQIIQEQGQTVGQLAFVERGAFALVVRTPAPEKTKAVGLVGPEGFIGVAGFLDDDPIALHSAVALQDGLVSVIPSDMLHDLAPEPRSLHKLCMGYTHASMKQMLTLASCGHPLPSRVACWLLLLRERLGTDELRITHESLAHTILGTRRAGVTLVAQELKNSGAIELRRATMVIADPDRLRELACDCYGDVCRRWEPKLRSNPS